MVQTYPRLPPIVEVSLQVQTSLVNKIQICPIDCLLGQISFHLVFDLFDDIFLNAKLIVTTMHSLYRHDLSTLTSRHLQ